MTSTSAKFRQCFRLINALDFSCERRLMFLTFLVHLHFLLFVRMSIIRPAQQKVLCRLAIQYKFHLVIDELLEWDVGEAGVGEDYVCGRLVLIVLVLGDVVGRQLNTQTINHRALRYTKRLTNL